MRSSILLSAAFAAGSLATPLFKRAYVTEVVEIVVTKYVTEGEAAPTKEREFVEAPVVTTVHRKWGWGRPPKPSQVQQSTTIVTVTPAPVPEPVTPVVPPSPPPVQAPEPVKTTIVQEAAAPKPTPSQAPAPAPVAQQPAAVNANTLAKLTSGPDYQAMVIRHHNFHRANHSVADLVWDDALASKALNDAQNHGTFSHTK